MTSRTGPLIRYARNGEINIAYQVLGSGPRDLVVIQGPATGSSRASMAPPAPSAAEAQ